jgi:hypothetical protein
VVEGLLKVSEGPSALDQLGLHLGSDLLVELELFNHQVEVVKKSLLHVLSNVVVESWLNMIRLVRLLNFLDPHVERVQLLFNQIVEVVLGIEDTVGYGDYTGQTSNEYIFSIILEFLGLTFFSFLMGSINGIFNTKDNFDDLIEEKLDSLDMWIKKIEKSNKPYHIQPTLYNDIRKYVEQAFLYDFNLVIEEFQFY